MKSNNAVAAPPPPPLRLKILGNMGGSCRGGYSMSAMIDNCLMLDAGTGAQQLSLAEMGGVSDILLTHSHLDHTASLFFLADCQVGAGGDGLRVHCLRQTADAVRRGFLNNEIWPDIENLTVNGKPMLTFEYLRPYRETIICGRRITPLPVRHAVPTLAYCLHGAREDFVYIADIIDAEEAFWEYLNALPRFRRMIIEVSFPDEMQKIADASFHLTPSSLARLLGKTPAHAEVYFCHAKPQFYDRIAEQILRRFDGRVKPLRRGRVFRI